MTKLEAIELLQSHKYWTEYSWMDDVAEIAIDCIQHCIDEEDSECYNCDHNHCDNCLYSWRIPE